MNRNEFLNIFRDWYRKSWKDIVIFLVFITGLMLAYDGYEKRQDLIKLETKHHEIIKQNIQYLETMDRLERALLNNTEMMFEYRRADARNHAIVTDKINTLLAIEKGEHTCQ